MNWTGGRLQQHSRSNSNKILKAQREHFARARLKAQRSQNDHNSPGYSSFDVLRQHLTDNASSHSVLTTDCPTGIAARRIPVDLRRGQFNHIDFGSSNDYASFGNSIPSTVPDMSLLRFRSLEPLGSPNHCVSIRRADNSFETTSRNLLNRADWLGTAVAKPLRIEFSPRKSLQRIGRRRKLICTVDSAYHHPGRNMHLASPEMLRNSRPSTRRGSPKEEECSTTTVPHINQKQTTNVPALGRSSSSVQSDISTGSQLSERSEKYVKNQKELHALPLPHADKIRHMRPEEGAFSKLVPLNAILECSSFDEIKQRSSGCASQSITASTEKFEPNARVTDDTAIAITPNHSYALEMSTPVFSNPSRTYNVDTSNALLPRNLNSFERLLERSSEPIGANSALNILRSHKGLPNDGHSPPWREVKHPTQFSTQRNRMFTIDQQNQRGQCVEAQISSRMQKPIVATPSFRCNLSLLTSSSSKASISTDIQTENVIWPGKIPEYNTRYLHGQTATYQQPEDALLASAKSFIQPEEDSMVALTYESETSQTESASHRLGRNQSAKRTLLEDNDESCVRTALAEDFERIQRDFEPPLTPTERRRMAWPIETPIVMGLREVGTYAPLERGIAKSYQTTPRMSRPTSTPCSTTNTTTPLREPITSSFDGDVLSNTCFSSQFSPTASVLDKHLLNTSIYNDATQRDHRFRSIASRWMPVAQDHTFECGNLITNLNQSEPKAADDLLQYRTFFKEDVIKGRPGPLLFLEDRDAISLAKGRTETCGNHYVTDLMASGECNNVHHFVNMKYLKRPRADSLETWGSRNNHSLSG